MNIRQALFCTIFLIISQALTMMLFLACRIVFHADPFSLYANLIISFGGLLFGLLGCVGAYPAARLTGTPPGSSLLALTILVTSAGVIFYQGLPYLLLTQGQASLAGFVGYVDARMAHSSLSFGHSDRPDEIGRYGYIFLALDLLWSTVGAFVFLGLLRFIPRCERCSTYFRRLAANKVSFDDMNEAIACLRKLPPNAAARAPVLMRMNARVARDRYGVVCIDVWRRECPSYRTQSMTEYIAMHNGKHFRSLQRETYFWTHDAS